MKSNAARRLELEESHDVIVPMRASWIDYLSLVKQRGESSYPRLTFANGTLEVMSPSADHERIKSILGHLVETFCVERDIDFRALGSWTLKHMRELKGLEPDECYIFGDHRPKFPDLAIEVVWTSGNINKLNIYKALGVREVWFWERGEIRIHASTNAYRLAKRSSVLRDIDMCELLACTAESTTLRAIKRYRTHLQRKFR